MTAVSSCQKICQNKNSNENGIFCHVGIKVENDGKIYDKNTTFSPLLHCTGWKAASPASYKHFPESVDGK
jgi:hypothetical protein